MKKKVLFIGLGGAGQRHLRLIFHKYRDIFKYYAYRKIKKTNYLDSAFNHFNDIPLNKIYPLQNISLKDIQNQNFDFVIISNPTIFHYEYLKLFLKKKCLVLVEKPLIFPIDEFNFIKNSKAKIYVGYQRKLTKIFSQVRDEIKLNLLSIKKITINVKSYVPEWHKYENYSDLYACRDDLGGGALYTECHELDMILSILGLPIAVKCNLESNSEFKISTNTNVKLKLYYKYFNVNFKINIFSKKIQRTINIQFNSNKKVTYDLNNNLIKTKFSTNNIDANLDPFEKQINLFFREKINFKNQATQIYRNNLIFKKALISANTNKKTKL